MVLLVDAPDNGSNSERRLLGCVLYGAFLFVLALVAFSAWAIHDAGVIDDGPFGFGVAAWRGSGT